MSKLPTFEEFRQAALERGFDAVLERVWQPGTVLDSHTHPFDADALVVQGEMWLGESQTTRPRQDEGRRLHQWRWYRAHWRRAGSTPRRRASTSCGRRAQRRRMRAVGILDIILRDEVSHVATGKRWYRWCCERDGLHPIAHYGVLPERHGTPRLHPPFNRRARRDAGFTQEEMDLLGG